MTSKIPGFLVAGLLAGPITAHSAVTISTDTATDLVGTFSVTGTSVEIATPSAFNFGLSFCLPVSVSRGTTAIAGLQCAGAPDDPRMVALERSLESRFVPYAVYGHHDPAMGESSLPLLRDKTLVAGAPALYPCRDFTSRLPITDPAEVARVLSILGYCEMRNPMTART